VASSWSFIRQPSSILEWNAVLTFSRRCHSLPEDTSSVTADTYTAVFIVLKNVHKMRV